MAFISEAIMIGSALIPTSSILMYGHDPTLLKTRGWVLEVAGYGVCAVDTMEAVKQIATSPEPIGLCILCHSLSPEASEEALATLNLIRPELKTLTILRLRIGSVIDQEGTVSAFDGPRVLVAAVKRLTGRDE